MSSATTRRKLSWRSQRTPGRVAEGRNGYPSPNAEVREIIDDLPGSGKGAPMLGLLLPIAAAVAPMFRSRRTQALEILALCQQHHVHSATVGV